ncbi:MAG: FHA domain-containing protein [Myxococcota bacterium]
MDKAELLSEFQAKVDEFARYQEFIAKAEAQAERFAPEVVQKVISTNRDKSLSVVEALIPLTADLEEITAGLESEKASITEATSSSQMAVQELELRLAIGELEQDAFDEEAASLKAELEEASVKIDAIDADLVSFNASLERWTLLGTEAGVLAPPTEADDADGEGQADLEVDDFDDALELDEALELGGADVLDSADEVLSMQGDLDEPSGFDEDEDLILGDADDDIVEIVMDDDSDDLAMEEVDVDGEGSGVHAEIVSVQDDMSVVFEDQEDHETKQEEVLLADDVLPADDDDLDILGEDEPLELDSADSGADLKPRRAVLLYAESSPEEQVHPVTKDVVSIGRGRDNDIQVRNDSKVSRYHCKIYRRGPNYYIEDNKSANGSLVNGELITERRLFGGEEIIVGETFFRFRILD